MARDHVRVNCLPPRTQSTENPEGLKPMCLKLELKHTHHSATTALFPLATAQHKTVSYNYVFGIC